MATAAVIPAAGRGDRLGLGMPKALVRLGGVTLLERSATVLAPVADLLVVAAPPDMVAQVQALVPDALVVPGGASRQESVRNALDVLPADVDIVLVHDAARALVPTDVVARVLDAVRGGASAAIPTLPVSDTVKAVDAGGVVTGTVDRTSLRVVQTPQGFRRDVLARAHAGAASDATDDAALVEALGIAVRTVEGSPEALKITTPYDLVVAAALLEQRHAARPAHV